VPLFILESPSDDQSVHIKKLPRFLAIEGSVIPPHNGGSLMGRTVDLSMGRKQKI
jgi:hypothetical protein